MKERDGLLIGSVSAWAIWRQQQNGGKGPQPSWQPKMPFVGHIELSYNSSKESLVLLDSWLNLLNGKTLRDCPVNELTDKNRKI